MACQSGLQPRTPLRHYVALFAPVGSMSLDFQVALLPYKSSSFATSRGRKTLRKYPWCHQCCMTESQSLLPLEESVAVRRRMIAAFQRKAEVLKGPDVTHSVYHELSVFLRAPPSPIPVGQLKGRRLYLSRFPLRWQANVICRRAAATRKSRETLPTGGTPRSGKGCTRLRMTMLLHCCSTQGQLCPTWQSYAGLPPEEGALRYGNAPGVTSAA